MNYIKMNVRTFLLFFVAHCLCITSLQSMGQRFILTLPHNTNPEFLVSWLEQTRPAGIMLLSSHFKERDQTKKLIAFLQEQAALLELPPLIIAVDWEGGIVSRPNESSGFFSVPSPWALAHTNDSTCLLAGMLIGQQLRSIGVTMNFAPSLDLYDPNNPILGTRCFSDNQKNTVRYGIPFANGLQEQGVTPCIKHFPGLGLGAGDTHLYNVEIIIDEEMFDTHANPFKDALNRKNACIMVTHASFRQFGEKPTTLSSECVSCLQSINPQALLITDDFCMNAGYYHERLEDNLSEALEAGYHLLIFSGTPEEQIRQIAILNEKYRNNSPFNHNILCSFINEFKVQQSLYHHNEYISINETSVSNALAQECVCKINPNVNKLTSNSVILISVDLTKIRPSEQWFIQSKKSYLCSCLEEYGIAVDEYIFNPNDIESITAVSGLLGTYKSSQDTHFIIQTFLHANRDSNSIQQLWLKILDNTTHPITLISLGHPSDSYCIPSAQHILLGSFHKPLLDCIASKLCGL